MPPIDTQLPKDVGVDQLLTHFMAPLEAIRQRRRYVEDEWLRNYSAWQGWPTVSHFLPLADGSIRYFVPFARRAIERINARIVKILMPQSKWFQVHPFDDQSHQKAEAVDAVFRYICEKKIKYKRIISSLARCLQMYNFAALCTSPRVMGQEVWPHQRVVDPYQLYLFPETAQDMSELLFLFEDCVMPFESYRAMTDPSEPDNGLALPLDATKLQAPEWPWHLVERLSYRGLTSPSDYSMGANDRGELLQKDFSERKHKLLETLSARAKAFVQMTSLHFKLGSDWYKAWIVYNYLDEPGETKPKIVHLDKLESQPLYQWAVQRPLPGELYTNSMMDDIRVLQILANNQLSQGEANRAVYAEPPVGVDVSQANRLQNYRYAPRAKWETDGDPNDVFKTIDVKDTSTTSLRNLQVTLGLINSAAGAGTIAEGQPGRNMPRAGFAVNSLINLALSDIQDIADTEEQEILSPGLGDMWHVVVAYTPRRQLFKIPGIAQSAPAAYNMADLYGDYTFSWMGTLQFQDQQTRADRLLKFLEILSNPAVFQMLQAQGKQVDIAAIMQQIWSDGLGERGLSQIIQAAPAPVMPMSGGQGAQVGGRGGGGAGQTLPSPQGPQGPQGQNGANPQGAEMLERLLQLRG